MNFSSFDTQYRERLDRINRDLKQRLPMESTMPEKIHLSMRYSVLAEGKRMRPILCLAVAEALGANTEIAIPVANALELIHTYSLIHDDLPCMDNDDYRRGRLTNHKVYGEDIAVLAGDALLTLAFEWIACAPGIAPEIKMQIIQCVSTSSGSQGLVAGQVMDLISEGKSTDSQTLQYIHTHKTGKLIQASVVSGARVAQASETDISAFMEFGLHLGLAFQITDDLLDVLGNSEKMGKAVQKDKQHHKATYPALYGIDKSKAMAKQHISDALRAVQKPHIQTGFLEGICHLVLERQN